MAGKLPPKAIINSEKSLRSAFLRNATRDLFQIRDLELRFCRITRNAILSFSCNAKERSHLRAAEETKGPYRGPEPLRAAELPAVRRKIANSVAVARIKKDSIEPTLPTVDEIRIMTENLGERLKLTRVERMLILRHQDDLAALPDADLVYKFFERVGIREIDHRVRLAAVTVAAGRDRNTESLGHLDDSLVLGPRSESVDLECVDPASVTFDEFL